MPAMEWISGRPVCTDDDFKEWASGRPFVYYTPTAGGNTYYESVPAFSSLPVLSPSEIADLLGGAEFASTPALITQNIADLLASVSLSSNPALISAGGFEILLAITVISDPAFSTVGDLDLSSSGTRFPPRFPGRVPEKGGDSPK